MEETEILSSAASDTDGFSLTENDDSFSEAYSEDTLDLVEDAILRTLREHSLQPNSENRKVGIETRLRGGFRSSGSENYSVLSGNALPARSSIYEDRALLANLLEQVHGLRRNETPDSRRSSALPTEVQSVPGLPIGGGFDRRRNRGKNPPSSISEELRMSLETAAVAAKAAADAAEATAVSVAKNTEAMELLVNSMKRSSQKRRKSKSKSEESISSRKEVDKRNRILQWTLGFIVAITVAWRVGADKSTERVADKLTEPIGYVGGLFGSGDESSKEEEKKVIEGSPEKLVLEKQQQIELPSIVLDSDHKMNGKERSDHLKHTPDSEIKQEDGKTFFNFSSFFQKKSTFR